MSSPRRVLTLLLFVALAKAVSPDGVDAQEGLPPGPAWHSAGPAALLDPNAPPAVAPLSFRGPSAWLAGAHPFGVPGLAHAELAGALSGRAWSVGLTWRQVAGDGMRHRYLELTAHWIATPPETEGNPEGWVGVRIGVSIGGHLLEAPEQRRLRASIWGVGTQISLPGGLNGAVQLRGSGRPAWIPGTTRWAVGAESGPLSLRFGEERGGPGAPVRALAVQLSDRHLRVCLGAWGAPPGPAIGLHASIGQITCSLESRWADGLGPSLLWSLRVSGAGGP